MSHPRKARNEPNPSICLIIVASAQLSLMYRKSTTTAEILIANAVACHDEPFPLRFRIKTLSFPFATYSAARKSFRDPTVLHSR